MMMMIMGIYYLYGIGYSPPRLPFPSRTMPPLPNRCCNTLHTEKSTTNNEPNTTSEYDAVMEYMINTMVMDGSRVSIRRWASMVFVWMYGGQSKGLEIVRNVLSHGEGGTTAHRHWWEDVMTTTITPASTFYSSYNNHISLAATAEYRTTARLTSYVLPMALRMADRINLPNIPLPPPTLLSSPPPPRVSDFMAV